MCKCKDCKYGYKRSNWVLKKYGSYYCNYECLITSEYKRANDKCALYKEKLKEGGSK